MAEEYDEQLNRQIIFTVIKVMWKLRAGPRKLPVKALYGRKVVPLMPANERTFDELIRYGREPSDTVQGKFDELADTLGIDPGYFRGTVPLELPNYTLKNWEEYFDTLDNLKAEKLDGVTKEKYQDNIQAFEQELAECLQMLPHELEMTDCRGRGFALYQLYIYYVLNTVVHTEQDGILDVLCGIMEAIDLKTLLDANVQLLQRYEKLLKRQATFAASALADKQ